MNFHFEDPNNFLEQIELLQTIHASKTPNEFKKKFGQFFTSKEISNFMSSLIEINNENQTYKLLDPCAGLGILGISTVLHLVRKGVYKIHIDVYEIDPNAAAQLQKNLELLKIYLTDVNFTFDVFVIDFLLSEVKTDYDIAVINPPYFKLAQDNKYRINKNGLFKKSPNVYSSFTYKSLASLKEKGQLAFITPRSFTNGSNFQEFRNLLVKDNYIQYIHLFNSRIAIFKNDNILQENVIFKVKKQSKQNSITVSNSDCIMNINNSELDKQSYPAELILNQFSKNIIAIPKSKESMEMYLELLNSSSTFDNKGYRVSTGKLVQFRTKNIGDSKQPDSIIIYNSHHLSNNELKLKNLDSSKKNKFLLLKDDFIKWVIPNQNYIFIRRISVKENQHRIILGTYFPDNCDDFIAVENHLNYIYHKDREMDKSEILGLAIFLKSSFVDNFFSVISGLTQINASDIREIPIPPLEDLVEISKNYSSDS